MSVEFSVGGDVQPQEFDERTERVTHLIGKLVIATQFFKTLELFNPEQDDVNLLLDAAGKAGQLVHGALKDATATFASLVGMDEESGGALLAAEVDADGNIQIKLAFVDESDFDDVMGALDG